MSYGAAALARYGYGRGCERVRLPEGETDAQSPGLMDGRFRHRKFMSRPRKLYASEQVAGTSPRSHE
jgi:hypothetical protein